jgi:hypothetical protein
MRRPALAVILACLLASPLAAADRADAEAAAAAGMQAMREADADPHKGVDAALAFSHALAIYKELGDVDAVCQMQADIFWCKKRMNMSDLQDYVAHKSAGTGTVAADYQVAKQVMETAVPVSEAAAYLERAKKFQAASPDQHFPIAIRFSEIIDRFPDTPEAKEANQVFAKEQSAYLAQVAEERKKEQAQLQQELDHARSNRFMRPPVVTAGSVAVPDKAQLDQAMATLRATYKDDYAQRKDAAKKAFARKLFGDAEGNKDNAATYYAILDESARLGLESEDYEIMLEAVEKQGEVFVGFNADARKRELLQRINGRSIATAILTLMKDPKDKRANLTAGKFWCFNMGRWELGLPMLSLGDDPDFHKVAEMELAAPRQPNDQLVTADGWYDVGKKTTGPDRIPAWIRAQHWYQQAMPGLDSVNKVTVQKRLDEIEDALPLSNIDWDNLTLKQWDKLKGQLVVVPSKVDRSNGGCDLSPGHRIRVVPHPDDKDKLQFQVGNPGERQGPGVLTGNGQLWIIPTTARRGGRDFGSLRVKILTIEDE